MSPLEDHRGRVINYAQGAEPGTVKKFQSAQSHEDQGEEINESCMVNVVFDFIKRVFAEIIARRIPIWKAS